MDLQRFLEEDLSKSNEEGLQKSQQSDSTSGMEDCPENGKAGSSTGGMAGSSTGGMDAELRERIGNAARNCGRRITKIIVHCSATPAGRNVSAAEIRRWHKVERGFSDIGYHYVVGLDGTVETGRPITIAGAHCKGQNATSVGVCYVGGIDKEGRPADTRTKEQKAALRDLLHTLVGALGNVAIYGHHDFAKKACPCFKAKEEYSDISTI